MGSNVTSIKGSGNIVAGGDIHMTVQPQRSRYRPKTIVQTGAGTINAAQKADLTRRVKAWVAVHNEVMGTPKSMAAAWSALNNRMNVNSYHELRPDQLPAAIKWLVDQRGRMLTASGQPEDVEGLRGAIISAIKARSKELGKARYYQEHIQMIYQAESLTELTEAELKAVRAWLFAIRKG
jgi:hypothetical protein